jgi:hypothetical protein
MPRALVAAAPRTRGAPPQVAVPTPVGGGCVLGVSVVAAAETGTVEQGSGACAQAAQALAPDSQARAVCPDGWDATRPAWRGRCPTRNVGRGLLHALRKRKQSGAGPWRHRGRARAWPVSQAATTRPCAQRLRRVAAWTPAHRSGAVAQRVWQRWRRRRDCPPASAGPQAHRPAQAVERRLDAHDRRLDARRSGHGPTDRARRAVRAMARQGHLHPYGARLRRDQPSRVSPLHDLHGVPYHSNWWHTLLSASSRGGLRH